MKSTLKGIKGTRQSGFTLVEIAIVLVIIGLILGGVLQGQVLVDNAKYKNFVKQIESFRASVYTFQDTYRGLPGDLLNVSALDSAAVAGDGDGLIEGGFCDISGEETCKVWSHLRYAGIISGDPTDVGATASPTHAYGGLVSSIGTGNWANGVNEIKILTRSIPGDVAQRYDNEFDDGDATTGDVARYGGSGSTYNLDSTVSVFISL